MPSRRDCVKFQLRSHLYSLLSCEGPPQDPEIHWKHTWFDPEDALSVIGGLYNPCLLCDFQGTVSFLAILPCNGTVSGLQNIGPSLDILKLLTSAPGVHFQDLSDDAMSQAFSGL